jgi:hypothetical protein
MKLEIFAQIANDGDLVCKGDHIFTGSEKVLNSFAELLTEVYAQNRRAKVMQVLAEQFSSGAKLSFPAVRLNCKEAQSLVTHLETFAANKPKTTKARKVYDHLAKAVSVF